MVVALLSLLDLRAAAAAAANADDVAVVVQTLTFPAVYTRNYYIETTITDQVRALGLTPLPPSTPGFVEL